MKTEIAWQLEATQRYLTNPETYARVQRAIGLTEGTCRRETGHGLTQEQLAAVTQAAIYGLLMGEADFDDIVGNVPSHAFAMAKAESAMMARAEELGMTVIKHEVEDDG